MAEEIKNHDIYITGSLNEPSGNHHIEAALCGLPILYFKSGGIPEYCNDYGLIFEENNFEDKLNEIYVLYNTNNYRGIINILSTIDFDEDLIVTKQWDVNGVHYSKTSKGWLKNHYKNKNEIMDIFKDHYDDPVVWFNRWRIFFLTCEVFFAMNRGDEYFVSHYLFEKTNS